MARIAFVYDDVALPGQGATASAATEADTDFPKENLVSPERKRMWRSTATPAGTINLDIDLGSAKAITGFGIHYLRSEAAAGSHPVINVQSSATSFASAATRASQTAAYWNDDAYGREVRDWVDTVAVQTHRYWRINCTSVASRFSIGKIVLGTGKDFGRLYTAGSEFQWRVPSLRARTVSQDVVDWPVGDPYKLFRYEYFGETDADRAVFELLARQQYPFGLLDSTGASNHVVLADGMLTRFSHTFNLLWTTGLEMEQMP